MLSLFNKKEAGNFVQFGKRNPYVLFKTGIEFLFLSFLGLKQRLTYSLIRDKHSLDKRRPKNVFINNLRKDKLTEESTLFLPTYFSHPITLDIAERSDTDEDDDIELYYAANRWSHCINALFKDTGEVQNAIGKAVEWIDKKIPKSDKAWEPYSSSERVANLVVLLAQQNAELTSVWKVKIASFLHDSIHWIDNHFEYYHSQRTNNHVLNNCRAMILAGVVTNNEVAVERGLILFSEMSRDLFLNDGFLRERSSHYQVIVTNWLLDAVHFAESYPDLTKGSRKPLRDLQNLSTKVIVATDLLLSSLKTDSIHIGDISPDYSPAVAIARLKLLYFGAKVSLVNQLSYIDNWLFMEDGVDALITNIPSQHPLKYPTHGHNDLGSFIWFNNGLPVIVDPGRYRYTGDSISNSQISAEGHNTLLINNLPPLADSLKLGGAWFPAKYANADIRVFLNNTHEFSIEHTGFKRIKGIGKHKRRINLQDSFLYVEDSIEGDSTCSIELNWHLGAGFQQDVENHYRFVNNDYSLEWISSEKQNSLPVISIRNYYLTSEYGKIQKANCINSIYKCSLPVRIITTFKIKK